MGGGRLGQEVIRTNFVPNFSHEEEAGPDCSLSAVTDPARPPVLFLLLPPLLLDPLQA